MSKFMTYFRIYRAIVHIVFQAQSYIREKESCNGCVSPKEFRYEVIAEDCVMMQHDCTTGFQPIEYPHTQIRRGHRYCHIVNRTSYVIIIGSIIYFSSDFWVTVIFTPSGPLLPRVETEAGTSTRFNPIANPFSF